MNGGPHAPTGVDWANAETRGKNEQEAYNKIEKTIREMKARIEMLEQALALLGYQKVPK